LMAAGLAAVSGLRWAIAATGLVLLVMTVWCVAAVREPPASAARMTAPGS
jgi:hypothetical protein